MDDRIHAILIEPQLERFRAICGLGDAPLTITFEGWHRLAILSPDRVFLFPRDRSHVSGLLREAAVLQALDGLGVPAPRLLGQWRDPEVSPYPFIAVSRLPGRTWSGLEASATRDQVIKVLEGLGQAIASWHRLDPRTLPRRIRARPSRRADTFAHHLDLEVLSADAIEATHRLGLPSEQASTWRDELEPLVSLGPVLVHGDVNEGQILVDDALHVTGILDWETAGVGHPLKDFDLGEWGYGIFAWERDFDTLRRAMWEAYARARDGALPSWRAVHLYYCLTWAAQLSRAKELTPWRRAHLENNLDLLRRMAD